MSGVVSLSPTPVVRDLRLAIGAVAAWLAAAFALSHGAGWAVGGAVGGMVLGLLGLALAARLGPVLSTLGLLGFCVVLVLAPLSARLHHASTSELAELAKARTQTTATLVVTADPRILAAKGAAGSPRVAVDASMRDTVINGRTVRVSGPVLILAGTGEFQGIRPGQRMQLDVTLEPPLGDGLLEAVAVAREDPELLGQPPWWQRAAGTVRDRLRRASSSLPAEPAGLLPGLVDGDTSDLDPVLAERFRIAGLTHLVAVSGASAL